MGMKKRLRATTPSLGFDGLGTGVALHLRRITTVATATALAVGLSGPVAALASPEAAADPVEVIVQEAGAGGEQLIRVTALDFARPDLDHLSAAVLLGPPADLHGL